MDKINTNVLIIGKSGVGKSSLLNYMFGREIQKTGTGSAITEEGIYPFDYEYDEHFNICIYDTWGLEADKANEWKDLICEEVNRHEHEHISEWFNTIIFCLSAGSNRVEDFELEIINELIKEKNQVMVAITHCKNNSDPSASTMKRRILEETTLESEQVVFVSSCTKKLIGGNVVKFGKQQVFACIIQNLWNSLKEKVPYSVEKYIRERFMAEKGLLVSCISNKWLLFQREKKLMDFEKSVNDEFYNFLSQILDEINSRFSEAMDYYNALSIKYAEIGLLDKRDIMNMPEMHFETQKGFELEVKEQVNIIKESLGSVISSFKSEEAQQQIKKLLVELKKYLSSSKEVKQTLNRIVLIHLDEAESVMKERVKGVQRQLQSINVEKIKDLMTEGE